LLRSMKEPQPSVGYIPFEPHRPSREAKWLGELLGCHVCCLQAPETFNLTRSVDLPSLDELRAAVKPLLGHPWVVTEGTGGFLWASVLRCSGFRGAVTVLPYLNPNSWYDLACLTLYKRTATTADQILIGSSRSAQLYRALGINAAIGEPYGIDGTVFFHRPGGGEAGKACPGLSRPFLIYAGRIHPDKSIHQLLRTILKARLLFPNLHTVLVSHNVDPEYYSLLSPYLSPDRGFFVVRNPNLEQLAALYADAAAFVTAATSHYETFGRAPVEALACGAPAIAPRYDGFADTLAQPGGTLVETLIGDTDVSVDEDALLRAIYDRLTSRTQVPAGEISALARARFDRGKTIRALAHVLAPPGDAVSVDPEPIDAAISLPAAWRRKLVALTEMPHEAALRSLLSWQENLPLFDYDQDFRLLVRRFLAGNQPSCLHIGSRLPTEEVPCP
jgi:glycosyltransferase involved in cell wall biosynthesis